MSTISCKTTSSSSAKSVFVALPLAIQEWSGHFYTSREEASSSQTHTHAFGETARIWDSWTVAYNLCWVRVTTRDRHAEPSTGGEFHQDCQFVFSGMPMQI